MSKLQEALRGIETLAPKVPLTKLTTGTYQAVKPQVHAESLNLGMMQAGMQIGEGIKSGIQLGIKKRQERGVERANEIFLKGLTPEQMKEARSSGQLLYQDDPYAMQALEREIGRQEAFNIDALVKAAVAKGDFPDRKSMENYRLELIKKSLENTPAIYGFDPTSSQFRDGFETDIVDRNIQLYQAQAVQTDQTRREEADVVVKNNIKTILETPEVDSVKGTIDYLNQQRNLGLIRNDDEYKKHMNDALTEVANKGDVGDVEAFVDAPITVEGKDTTIRALLGDAQTDQFIMTAGTNAYMKNQEKQIEFQRDINKITHGDMSTLEGVATAKAILEKQWNQVFSMNQDHPMWTKHKDALIEAEAQLNANIRTANEKQKVALKEDFQTNQRYDEIDARVERRLTGEGVPLGIDTFEETQFTGKYTTNDFAMYFNRKLEAIDADETLTPKQRSIKKMTIGNVMKDADKAGFGAWYNSQMGTIQNELDSVSFAVSAGMEIPDTPTFNQYGNMYAEDPKLFMNVFGEDAQMALNLATAKSLSVDYATYMKGAKTVQSLDVAARKQFDQEWAAQVDKSGGVLKKLTPQQREIYRGWAAATHGVGFNTALARIVEHADANFISVGDIGTVKRSVLMTNDKVESADEGAEVLETYMQNQFGSDYKRSQAYSVGDNIIIMNPNGAREVISRQKFLEIYAKTK